MWHKKPEDDAWREVDLAQVEWLTLKRRRIASTLRVML